MINRQATSRANSNIAFIKYWGNTNDDLRLPANSSISMNLDSLFTETTVIWDNTLSSDQLTLNGIEASGNIAQRVSKHLNIIRRRVGINSYANILTYNNFPMGAGIASSASSFAALTVAAVTAAQIELTERELSTIARLGSGSASRSIPAGFVEWHMGNNHEESFAETIAPSDHWDLIDLIAVVNSEHKAVGSSQGHASAKTSDLQNARIAGAANRLVICKDAILSQDFHTFAEVVEYDSNLMHAVMMTSRPPLFYWKPATLTIMEHVRQWRSEGLNVCYTLDAGPNVHCICLRSSVGLVSEHLLTVSAVENVFQSGVGYGAKILAVE